MLKSKLIPYCLILCCIAFAIPLKQTAKAQISKIAKHISPLMNISFDIHVKKNNLTPELGAQIMTNYVKMLDPSKLYFTKSEVDKVFANKIIIPSSLENNRWSFPTNVFSTFINKVKLQHTNAINYLCDPDFKVDKSRSVIIDYKKVDFPKNQAEANNRMHDNIQYQIAYLLSIDEPLTNAITKVTKRFNRTLKRYLKFDLEDQNALFINAFCLALDPHTSYMTQDVLEDFEIHMALSLEGIGALLSSPEGITEIKSLTPGGPAEKSGLLKPGDKIVAVAQGKDGEYVDIIDMDIQDVVKKIRGKKDSIVRLKIVRKGDEGTQKLNIEITRDKINLEDKAAQLQIVNIVTTNSTIKKIKIGVIDLPSFYLDQDSRKLFGDYSRSAVADVTRLLNTCQTSNVDGVILDMQRNGGGLLDEAVSTAGLFIKKGNVVLARNRAHQVQVLPDTNGKINYNGPLIVTVSRATASAAEIVSGALKAYKRAIIVGDDHTFGKGTIQQVIPLNSELGALKITSGEYFIASGNSPQNIGIIPDIILPSDLQAFEIGERYESCALPSPTTANKLSPPNKTGGDGSSWTPVSTAKIDMLRSNALIRVANSAVYSNMLIRINKNLEDRKKTRLTIAEILDSANTNTIETVLAATDEKVNSITNSPLVSEAINIMVDWLTISEKPKRQKLKLKI